MKNKFTFTEKRDVTVKGYSETIEAYVAGMEKTKNESNMRENYHD